MVRKQSAAAKTFSYPWGSGIVAEEARVAGEHHVPAIQLLKYSEGEAAGHASERFCAHSHRGAFQRTPLLLGTSEIDQLREALRKTPELPALLSRLLD